MNVRIIRGFDGRIVRRLLVNATAAAELVQPQLPPGCTPIAVGGDERALVGICVVRVDGLRPAGLPVTPRRSFEGLAHRIAARRPDGTPAVHIVRRETADHLALLVGGRLFPGTHCRVDLHDGADDLQLRVSGHGGPDFLIDATGEPPPDGLRSVLGDDTAASAFFTAADTATSPSRRRGRQEVVRMQAEPFLVRSVQVREVVLDRLAWALGDLPPSALSFDSAFVVRDVPVRFVVGASA